MGTSCCKLAAGRKKEENPRLRKKLRSPSADVGTQTRDLPLPSEASKTVYEDIPSVSALAPVETSACDAKTTEATETTELEATSDDESASTAGVSYAEVSDAGRDGTVTSNFSTEVEVDEIEHLVADSLARPWLNLWNSGNEDFFASEPLADESQDICDQGSKTGSGSLSKQDSFTSEPRADDQGSNTMSAPSRSAIWMQARSQPNCAESVATFSETSRQSAEECQSANVPNPETSRTFQKRRVSLDLPPMKSTVSSEVLEFTNLASAGSCPSSSSSFWDNSPELNSGQNLFDLDPVRVQSPELNSAQNLFDLGPEQVSTEPCGLSLIRRSTNDPAGLQDLVQQLGSETDEEFTGLIGGPANDDDQLETDDLDSFERRRRIAPTCSSMVAMRGPALRSCEELFQEDNSESELEKSVACGQKYTAAEIGEQSTCSGDSVLDLLSRSPISLASAPISLASIAQVSGGAATNPNLLEGKIQEDMSQMSTQSDVGIPTMLSGVTEETIGPA